MKFTKDIVILATQSQEQKMSSLEFERFFALYHLLILVIQTQLYF